MHGQKFQLKSQLLTSSSLLGQMLLLGVGARKEHLSENICQDTDDPQSRADVPEKFLGGAVPSGRMQKSHSHTQNSHPGKAETQGSSEVQDPWLCISTFKWAGSWTFTNPAGRVITNPSATPAS